MSLFDKIKSVFLEEVNESPDKDNDTPPVEPEPKVVSSNTRKGKNTPKKIDVTNFENILFKAIENANIEGFDYLEYIKSISNLKKQNDFNNDEKMLFKSAYALAKTMNVDKEALLKSADNYLSVLSNERVRFNDSLNNNASVKLNNKKQAKKVLLDEMEKDTIEYERLKKKMELNNKKLQKINSEIDGANKKIEDLKVGFQTALHNLSAKIERDKNKIEKYIN